MNLRTTLINCIVIVSVLFYSNIIIANIINVPGDHSTIQAAINAASSGDTILVQAGTYNENINFNGKAVTVGSLFVTTGDEAYIATTIINGGGSASCVKFNSDETATSVLSGFTITNGYAYYGAGIYCYATSPTLSYLDIVNNNGHAGDSYGGGLVCMDNSTPNCSNLTFTGNYANEGGGVWAHNNGDATFSDCIFTDNTSSHGGGMQISYSSPEVDHCLFYENNGPFGGAVYVFNYSTPEFVNCTFSENTSTYGGAFYCSDLQGQPTILNCILWDDVCTYNLEIFATSSAYPPIVTYSDVENGTGENWFGTGCIDADPLFTDASNDDYTLAEFSPCIDTGDPASPPDPDGSNADMGAYPYLATLAADFYADNTEVCQGNAVQFTDASIGAPTIWNWTFEGGTPATSTDQNPMVIYNTIGNFDVTLEVSDGEYDEIIVKEDYINVSFTPLPEISGLSLVCDEEEADYTTLDNPGNTYNWTIAGGEIINGAGTNQITVLWGVPGPGTVELIETSDDCVGSAETLEVTIDDCTGFEEAVVNKLNIYPNPATNYINIQSESLIKTISILDFTGKKVAYENAHNNLYQLNTSKLKPGIYLLMIETEAAGYTERMIIE